VIYLQFAGQALLFAAMRLVGAVRSLLDYRVLWATDPTPFFLTGRAITALFGAAMAPAALALGRRLAGNRAGWLAGLLVAIHPVLLARSQEIEVDIPLALFVTLGCVQALRLREQPLRGEAVLAGLLAGLAASCKYTGAIVLLPCVGAALLARPLTTPVPAVSAPARGRARAPVVPRQRRSGERASGHFELMLIVIGAALAGFLLTSPYVAIDRAAFWRDLSAERQHMALGQFGSAGGAALPSYLRALVGEQLGWPLAVLALVGIAVRTLVRRDRDAILIGLTLLAYLGIVGSWTMRADRYLLPVLPLAIVFAATGAAEALSRLVPASAGRGPRALAWLAVIVIGAAPMLAYAAHGDLAERQRPDSRTAALLWIRAHVPEGAFVASESYGPVLASFTLPDLMGDVAPALAGHPHRPPIYAVQTLPMMQVAPERSATFYDVGLYRDADLVIVTSAVRDRYRADPARFPSQCAFYDSLEHGFARAGRWGAPGYAGPEVIAYRRPDATGWFGARDSVAGPPPFGGAPSGLENYFFWNMGVNYESAGLFTQAIACYRIGLRYPPRPADTELYASIASRLAYCLLATNTPQRAIRELAAVRAQAKYAQELAAIDRVGEQLARDPTRFAGLGIPRVEARANAGR
jgi:hypothetical protein